VAAISFPDDDDVHDLEDGVVVVVLLLLLYSFF
jgi:hypothetical protein